MKNKNKDCIKNIIYDVLFSFIIYPFILVLIAAISIVISVFTNNILIPILFFVISFIFISFSLLFIKKIIKEEIKFYEYNSFVFATSSIFCFGLCFSIIMVLMDRNEFEIFLIPSIIMVIVFYAFINVDFFKKIFKKEEK